MSASTVSRAAAWQQRFRWIAAIGPLCFASCSTKLPYEGKSVAELERMLRSADPAMQAQGALGLSRHGARAASCVPALAEALTSAQPLVRQNAALSLGAIGEAAAPAVPALIARLTDSEWAVRRQAAVTLGQIGPAARPATDALKKLGKDANSLVAKAAREAIKSIPQ